MMAQTQTEKQNMNFAGKKDQILPSRAQARSQFSFPFHALISFVLLTFFFVFVFALNPIVTSKIFLVFGTGALKRAPPFLF